MAKKITCGPNFCRETLRASRQFDPRSFRTIRTKYGKRVVLACPIGKWKPRKQRCTVTMKAQAILRPRPARSKRR